MQHEITPEQHQAIELLITGMQHGCVADKLNIRRETLWRWRQTPAFQQMLAMRRHMLREGMREQLAELVRLALLAIERDLRLAEDPKRINPLGTALTILRMLDPAGLMAEPAPPAGLTLIQDSHGQNG